MKKSLLFILNALGLFILIVLTAYSLNPNIAEISPKALSKLRRRDITNTNLSNACTPYYNITNKVVDPWTHSQVETDFFWGLVQFSQHPDIFHEDNPLHMQYVALGAYIKKIITWRANFNRLIKQEKLLIEPIEFNTAYMLTLLAWEAKALIDLGGGTCGTHTSFAASYLIGKALNTSQNPPSIQIVSTEFVTDWPPRFSNHRFLVINGNSFPGLQPMEPTTSSYWQAQINKGAPMICDPWLLPKEIRGVAYIQDLVGIRHEEPAIQNRYFETDLLSVTPPISEMVSIIETLIKKWKNKRAGKFLDEHLKEIFNSFKEVAATHDQRIAPQPLPKAGKSLD